ncbi:MAG: hypothetical protein KBT33_03725 [Prevotellaceae bacterium]|nr:hypothetical protein [Candidatus Minthosoma equi]
MKDNKVILTVVGIRNYCEGGEAGLPELFKRYPIGSILYLSIDTSGEKYSGAVRVFDSRLKVIGTISRWERHFIDLAIPKDGMLDCRVAGHSLEDKCMYVEAVNNVGENKAVFRKIDLYEGETVIPYTKDDLILDRHTKLLYSRVNQENPSIDEVLDLSKEYAKICCTSLDGPNGMYCHGILSKLRALNKEHRVFDDVIHEIHEKNKDLGSKKKTLMTQVYHDQYKRILDAANAHPEGESSYLENYLKTLTFVEGNKPIEDAIEQVIKKLSVFLSKTLANQYVQSVDKDEDFANQLYYLSYDLQSTYLIYTRRIKRDFLIDYLHNLHAQEQQSDKAANHGASSSIKAKSCSSDELPLPGNLNTKRAQKYFKKAIEKGFIAFEDGKFSWIQIGNRGGNSQLAYFCGEVYEYEHSEYGNAAEIEFPEEALNELFGVKRLYALLTQVYSAQKYQLWRRRIDEMFE